MDILQNASDSSVVREFGVVVCVTIGGVAWRRVHEPHGACSEIEPHLRYIEGNVMVKEKGSVREKRILLEEDDYKQNIKSARSITGRMQLTDILGLAIMCAVRHRMQPCGSDL